MKNSFLLFFLFSASTIFTACSGDNHITTNTIPGMYDNFTLLPNGWKLSPEGEQTEIGELPLNMIVTKDSKYAITTNNGTEKTTLSVIEINSLTEVQRIKIPNAWRGISFNKDESLLYASGGNNNCIYIFSFKTGKLSLKDSITFGKPYPKGSISIAGITYCASKNFLLVVTKETNELLAVNTETKKIVSRIKMAGKCFDVITNDSETLAYVSVWAGSCIAVVDLLTFKQTATIKTGDHPCEMIITKDNSRLFVANANNNSVSQIDLATNKEIEKLNTALSPDAPFGSTPNALSFNKDESALLIANADNNYLSLFNIKEKGKSFTLGFIPTGWYPTSVKVLTSGKLLITNGKGSSSKANSNKDVYRKIENHVGRMFKGTIQKMDYPDIEKLNLLSKKVFDNTPYIAKGKNFQGIQSVISDEHDGIASNKIKYVFYIIKENKTYDQVFGDIEKGNGDPSLTLFPENITPNQHKLANNYVLFDNFYCDAEVSADGHNWSMAAYTTDYVEKLWPGTYGGRGGAFEYESDVPISSPSSGYIWDAVLKAKKTPRFYGEFVNKVKDSAGVYCHNNKYLQEYTCTSFPNFDFSYSDLTRFEIWSQDFDKTVESGNIPNLSIIRLPNNHTNGTRPGGLTPKAFVAQNDYALGLMIDKISNSKIWKESIVFVLEDDAQSGTDHVDAHRSPLLVVGPYIKRNFVDHTMYSTSSVLKTIELILGAKPMTQFDLGATPIFSPVSDTADSAPFAVVKPKIDIEEKNPAKSYGSLRSMEMDFSREDAIDEMEFNEIIWRSVKGEESVMPSPIRSAFVKIIKK